MAAAAAAAGEGRKSLSREQAELIAAADEFFRVSTPPRCTDELRQEVEAFCSMHAATGRRLVCVTSGGTTVPLERNTVRFISNFSSGTRGAASVEYFVRAGYAVVFLNRRFSIQPYNRHILEAKTNVLDLVRVDDSGRIVVTEETQHTQFPRVVAEYHEAMSQKLLLRVPFETVFEYLFFLRVICEAFAPYGRSTLVYLAAAVSDFYVPEAAMPEHKIQSSEGPPPISLQEVPKMLQMIRFRWAPEAYVVSFKLETDISMLEKKSRDAIARYDVNSVVANMLHSYKEWVVVYRSDGGDSRLSRVDGEELEKPLVQTLVQFHDDWVHTDEAT